MRAESQKPGAADGKHRMGWKTGTGDASAPAGPGQSPWEAISSRRATPSQEWSMVAPGAPLGWELGAGGVSRTGVAQSQGGNRQLRALGSRSWKAGVFVAVSSQGFEGPACYGATFLRDQLAEDRL